MLNIVKEKLDLSPDLKKKIDWAKKYTSTPIKLEKGHLIRLEPSNLAYVDPHKVIINDYTFLFFNGINTFYVNNLNEQHNLSELEKLLTYFKKMILYITNERGNSRNGGTSIKTKHNISKNYNIKFNEESVVFRLY